MRTSPVAGPWHVVGNCVKCIDHGRYYTVARVHNPKFTPEGNEANARLIAAAPELLEALESMLFVTARSRDVPEGIYQQAKRIVANVKGE